MQNVGWKCPVCGAGVAPWKEVCPKNHSSAYPDISPPTRPMWEWPNTGTPLPPRPIVTSGTIIADDNNTEIMLFN